MANIEDCPGFETFGADVKAARNAKHLSRRALAEIIDIDSRYLANIENEDTIPALPVIIQLIKVCGLPVELWGDRIFEKCGIGRDEGGDGGKTLEIRGKRRLSARDGGANYQQS